MQVETIKGCSILVFDLDDTLYPEHEYVRSGFAAVDLWLKQNRDITGFSELANEQFNSGKRGNIFDIVLDQLGCGNPAELVPALVKVYREHDPAIKLYPDAEWALAHFRPKYRLGVISDGYLVSQEKKVAALGIKSKVETVILSDLYGRSCWKPSAVPFSKLVEALACEHHHCVYVGDNVEKDFVTARKLGWRTIQVLREGGEYRHRQPPADYHAEYKITSLRELSSLLPM